MDISSPRELIAAIPHLLGFAPEDSLVITALDENRVISMVRVDWPIADSVLSGSLARYAETVRDCDIALAFYGGNFTHDSGVIKELFTTNCIVDELHICENRWRSQMCDDPVCCPAEGRDINSDTAVMDAEFVYRGSMPFDNRDQLVESLMAQKLTESERARCITAFAHLEPEFDAQAEVDWFLQQDHSHLVTDWVNIARGARACQEIRIRDGLLRRAFDSIATRVVLREWLIANLCRIPEAYIAASATVLAGVVWLDGNGPLARIALDRALEADPEYSLAQLLDTALVNAVPSRIWSESLEAVSYEECLRGAA